MTIGRHFRDKSKRLAKSTFSRSASLFSRSADHAEEESAFTQTAANQTSSSALLTQESQLSRELASMHSRDETIQTKANDFHAESGDEEKADIEAIEPATHLTEGFLELLVKLFYKEAEKMCPNYWKTFDWLRKAAPIYYKVVLEFPEGPTESFKLLASIVDPIAMVPLLYQSGPTNFNFRFPGVSDFSNWIPKIAENETRSYALNETGGTLSGVDEEVEMSFVRTLEITSKDLSFHFWLKHEAKLPPATDAS